MTRGEMQLPDRLAGVGVLGLGLAWGLSTLLVRPEAVTGPSASQVLSLAVGGVAITAIAWVSTGAVLWAMARLLQGAGGFLDGLTALSAIAVPLWAATPAIQLLRVGDPGALAAAILGAIAVGGTAVFLQSLAVRLQASHGFSKARSWACIALVAVFQTSAFSLYS